MFKLLVFLKFINRDNVKLYDLLDLILEIEFFMVNLKYIILLSYFNVLLGLVLIFGKFLYNM